MDEAEKNYMKSHYFSKQIRKDVLKLSHLSGAAHLGSCLSVADILAVIFTQFLNNKIIQNKFILSKGHAAMALYSSLKNKKIISKKLFNSYCKINSPLEEHPSPKCPGVEVATGSLGHGICIAGGIALANKIKKNNRSIFVLCSDGECNEGSFWEAILFAAHFKLNNLKILIDCNKWQATGRTKDVLNLNSYKKKFLAMNCEVAEINGHNHKKISDTLKKKRKKPLIVVCNTIKGKGVKFMEDDNNWHYRSPSEEDLSLALKNL